MRVQNNNDDDDIEIIKGRVHNYFKPITSNQSIMNTWKVQEEICIHETKLWCMETEEGLGVSSYC